MKLNSDTKIKGQNIMLVPYREYHVPKYHEWMKSEDLRQLTASEPLTLVQEYEMQKSWREDEDKCTFIILDKSICEKCDSEIDAMIGDINVFITDKERAVGEVEIMIADELARGKRFGWEAVILMLLYSINNIDIKIFEAKISLKNNISIRMFEKLGFEEISRSEVFQEITFEKRVCEEWIQWLKNNVLYQLETC